MFGIFLSNFKRKLAEIPPDRKGTKVPPSVPES